MIIKFSSLFLSVLVLILSSENANGALHGKTRRMIDEANKNGPYLGLVIPNMFEMNPLLKHPDFHSSNLIIDYAGRRFRFGKIVNKPVILVMSGSGMIKGVVHYGTAGNANPNLNIGDVAIAHDWSHSAVWSWQRYGDGPEDELPFEGNGFTREIGYLKFASFSTIEKDGKAMDVDNLLNGVWYQPEEVYPVDGTPEKTQQVFWVPVGRTYFKVSKSLESLKLEGCINATTCLSKTPKVIRVQKGTSASIFVDNAAYRTFLHNKFDVSLIDMESAAVALISSQQKIPFIIFGALSNLAGAGSAESNEANTFSDLAAENCVKVVVEFIKKV